MAIIKVCFNGISPTETVNINGELHRNGAIVEAEEAFLMPYVGAGVAFEIKTKTDLEEALKVQDLENRNLLKRIEILEKAGGKGGN